MPNRFTLYLSQTLYQELVNHARTALPNECCGLLAGNIVAGTARAIRRFPLVNVAPQPKVEFLSEPRSSFAADKAMRAAALDVIAVYHSHPTSAALPSKKDIASNYSEAVMNLIISLKDGQLDMRAWWLWENGFEEGKWEFAGDDGIGGD